MDWTEFQELQPNDKVITTKWGTATVSKWVSDQKLEVILCKFSRPNTRCKKFARTEIKEKL
jgi:hypothetical protein